MFVQFSAKMTLSVTLPALRATTMMSRHESPDTRILPPCQPDKINKLGLQTQSSAPNKWGALSTPSRGERGGGRGGDRERELAWAATAPPASLFQEGEEGHGWVWGVVVWGCISEAQRGLEGLATSPHPITITKKMAYLVSIYPESHKVLHSLQNNYINRLSGPPLISQSISASELMGGDPQMSASNPRRDAAPLRWVVRGWYFW